MRTAGLAVLLCLSTHLAWGNANVPDVGDANGSSVFQQFKKFISDPPPMEIVFSYQGPLVSRYDRSKARYVKGPAPVQFIRAQWGSDYLLNLTTSAFKDLEIEPLSERFVLKEGEMLVRSGNDFWSFSGPIHAVTHWHGTMDYPFEGGNSFQRGYYLNTAPLFALMNMGPHLVLPRTIKWSDNRFKCVTRVPEGVFLVEGELFKGADGFPEKMTYRIRSVTGDDRYVVRYEYSTNSFALPSFMPEHIQSFVSRGTNNEADKDIRILSLRWGTPLREIRPDEVARWINHSGVSQVIYTNQDYYSVASDGSMRFIPRPNHVWGRRPIVLAYANRYYYVATCLAGIGFLVLFWRMRRQTKQMTKGIP